MDEKHTQGLQLLTIVDKYIAEHRKARKTKTKPKGFFKSANEELDSPQKQRPRRQSDDSLPTVESLLARCMITFLFTLSFT